MDPTQFSPYVSRLFQIESGGDPYAQTGSNRGLGQFGPQEEAKYGINDQNRADPNTQATAVSQETAANTPALTKALGRAPSPGELYLAHQQGIAGAPALLTGGDTPAWQAIRPYYGSDAIAKKAITGNPFMKGMDPNISASDFSRGWVGKFEQHPVPGGSVDPTMAYTGGGSGSAPTPAGILAIANQMKGAASMPDTTGALDPASLNAAGAGGILGNLYGSGWNGPGGVGNTLQNVGAWLQSANNPGGAASLLQQSNQQRNAQQAQGMQLLMGGKPQLVPAGADPVTGRMRFVLFNPLTGKVSTPQLGGAPGTPGGPGGSAQDLGDGDIDKYQSTLNAFQNGKASPQDVMQSAPAIVRQYADSLIKGTADPALLGNRAGVMRPLAIQLAHVMDPSFNDTTIPARKQTMLDLADKNNKAALGGAMASSEKIVGHINDYIDLENQLHKLQWYPNSNDANAIQSAISAHSTDPTYRTIKNRMDLLRTSLAGETTNLMAGGKGGVEERKELAGMLDPSKSLDEIVGAGRTIAQMMRDTVDPLVGKYNMAFGIAGKDKGANDPIGQATGKQGEKTTEDFWSPKTNAAYQRLMDPDLVTKLDPGPAPASTAARTTTPSGTPLSGPAPTAAPAAAPTAAPAFVGRTATGPGGARMREISPNNWVPY